MRIIGINLIFMRSTQLSGIGKLIDRFFIEMKYFDLSNFKFIIYIQKNIDEKKFSLPENMFYEIIKVPAVGGGVKLVVFEQTLFHFWIKKCDLMYSPNYATPWFGRRRKVVSILDIYPIIYKKSYGIWKRFWSKILYKLNANFADVIITISDCSKNDLTTLLHIKPEKIKIINCFIPVDEFKAITDNHSEFLISDSIIASKPYFLSVSVLKPVKNYEGLIMAFSIFHQNHPEYKLYIVGSKGWHYDSIFHIVKNNNLIDSVIFTGYISDSDINILYSNCEGVILVSFYEGFGYTPLEGFYHNKPCVVSDVASIPEVVGNAGIYVNPYDIKSIYQGMETFIQKKDELKKYIPEQIQKFNPHIQTNKLLEIFISL